MTDVFRIETDQTRLSWSDRSPSASTAETGPVEGRLAISLSSQRRTALKIWRHGLPTEAANNPEVELGPRLYEERSYDLLLQSKGKQVELRHRDPVILQALHHSIDGDSVYGSDRKSTRLNSSHSQISYAVFCLKKKKKS